MKHLDLTTPEGVINYVYLSKVITLITYFTCTI